jgi:hypothetical protein
VGLPGLRPEDLEQFGKRRVELFAPPVHENRAPVVGRQPLRLEANEPPLFEVGCD